MNNIQKIDLLLQKAVTFVAFSYMNSNEVNTWIDISEKKLNKTFEVKSFDGKSSLNIIPSHTEWTTELESKLLLLDNIQVKIESTQSSTLKENYLDNCNGFINSIKEGKFKKIILSRIKNVDFEVMKIGKLFNELNEKYPKALVYLFHKENEIWIGATPEILAEFNQDRFKTISLAGTQKGNAIQWQDKEVEEQKIVTDYILDTVAKNEVKNLEVKGPFTYKNGIVSHLKTEIKGKFNGDKSKFLSELHPTPAICGIPKEEAHQYILDSENHNRKYYCGYLSFKEENKENYYVNLRCAELFSNSISLYLGGGITAQSEPEKEWDETELKAQTLLSVIQNL